MHILVTAGPTREYLDPVRFLSNPSSGRMGFAVARAALRKGHQVTLVSGPVVLRPPKGANFCPVTSADQMARACMEVFDDVDAAVMTAAVCDFRPTRRARHKQKKSGQSRTLPLRSTTDIAAALGRRKIHQRLVAFAVDDRQVIQNARAKLTKKKADLIVSNSPAAFAAERSDVRILGPAGVLAVWPDISKDTLARRLIGFLESGRLPRQRRT